MLMTSFRLLGIDCGRWGVLRLTRFRFRADDAFSVWLDPVSGPMTCFPSDSLPSQGRWRVFRLIDPVSRPDEVFSVWLDPVSRPDEMFSIWLDPVSNSIRCFSSDSILSQIQSGVFHLTRSCLRFSQVFSVWLDPVPGPMRCCPSDSILSQIQSSVFLANLILSEI